MSKIVSVEEAVSIVKDEDVVAVEGFVGSVTPEELLLGLEQRFLREGRPRNLTIVASTGQGDMRGRGLDHLAHEGLLKRVISTYYNVTPRLQRLILENKIEAYMFPLGVLAQLYREIAGGRPGVITHVGLGTFVDPRQEGGKINSITKEDLVEVVNLVGREWLLYKSLPINVAFIRGTTADERGNISMEKEIAVPHGPSLAQAAKRWGGKVIAQVERIAAAGTINPRLVEVPGILVDAVVVARPENHMQTFKVQYNPSWSGELRVSIGQVFRALPLDDRKVIGRRAALELWPNAIVNLGVGMPEFVASIAGEEGASDLFTLTVESGATGGIPAYGLSFGAATNAEAIIHMPYQFDFYDGGGIDISFVGFAQIDAVGNVNVSKLNSRIPGVGGFLNVTQNAKKVVFCGTFTAGGTEVAISEEGWVQILKEGPIKKFVRSVSHVTFSGEVSRKKNQRVLYVTERGVFELTAGGIMLVEIAPGVNLERDILGQMEFRPLVSPQLKEMPAFLFKPGRIDLARRLTAA